MRISALPGAREGHRQRGGAGLADARLDEVRRQHCVGVKTQVGECRVDERLGELARCEVHQRRLEERSGAQHLAERHCVAPKEIERALQFLLSVVQNLQDTVEFVQRRLELRPVVVHQPGYLMRYRREVVHQCIDRSALRQNLSQQGVGVDDQLGDLIAALAQHRGDLVGIGKQVAQLCITRVEGVGEACHPFEGDPQLGRGVGEGVRQCGERRGQLRGVQGADRRGQIAQCGRQIIGRLGSLQGNGAGELTVASRRQFEHLGAEYGFGLDRGLGSVTEVDTIANGEVHQHLRAFKADIGDPADGHARHPHVTTGLDAAGLGEVGRVVGGALDEGNLVVGEGGDDRGHEHGDSDEADDEPVALGERFDVGPLERESRHFGVHRPVSWPASLTYTGWPPLPLTLSTASQR